MHGSAAFSFYIEIYILEFSGNKMFPKQNTIYKIQTSFTVILDRLKSQEREIFSNILLKKSYDFLASNHNMFLVYTLYV